MCATFCHLQKDISHVERNTLDTRHTLNLQGGQQIDSVSMRSVPATNMHRFERFESKTDAMSDVFGPVYRSRNVSRSLSIVSKKVHCFVRSDGNLEIGQC